MLTSTLLPSRTIAPAGRVVITDTSSPAAFRQALAYVTRSVPAGVDVVAVTSRSPVLDAKLARRVRKVRARLRDDVTATALAEATGDRLTVVLGSECELTSTWWSGVQDAARQRPCRVTDLGGGGTHVLVHPPGVVGRATGEITISASLIVKDEERVLAECLSAIAPFVDEIVVYDTGSTDRTVQIARAHGVAVVQGYWNEHFGDARNRALEHCTGDWVIHVDADEVAQGDPAALRSLLEHEVADLLHVPVVSTSWSGGQGGAETRPLRIFRRTASRWAGALHEHLVPADPARSLVRSTAVAPLRLMHSGYQATAMHEKDKHSRNLAVAHAAVGALEVGADGADVVWCDYGRALMSAGRIEEALDAFAQVKDIAVNSAAVLQAGRCAVACLEQVGRYHEAEGWWELMAGHGESGGALATSRARVELARGDLEAAERWLSSAVPGRDLWGVEDDPAEAEHLRVRLDEAHGRHRDALERLVRLAVTAPESVPLSGLLRYTAQAQAPLSEVLGRMSTHFVAKSLREAVALDTDQAERWLRALHEAAPSEAGPVVAGNVVAARGALAQAMTWSLLARERGLVDCCALRAFGQQEWRPLQDRCLAWGVLREVFSEAEAARSLAEAVSSMTPAERQTLARRLGELGLSPVQGTAPAAVATDG